MRPFLDKTVPEAWAAAESLAAAVRDAAQQRGLDAVESELIKVRASQLNGCVFCIDLHSRAARQLGAPQQKLDLLPAWREATIYTERERAVLAIAEAATVLPIAPTHEGELAASREVLGDELFAAAEWVAVTINAFNRISILSQHPVRARDAAGKLIR